jgi:hypothetical protein
MGFAQALRMCELWRQLIFELAELNCPFHAGPGEQAP